MPEKQRAKCNPKELHPIQRSKELEKKNETNVKLRVEKEKETNEQTDENEETWNSKGTASQDQIAEAIPGKLSGFERSTFSVGHERRQRSPQPSPLSKSETLQTPSVV